MKDIRLLFLILAAVIGMGIMSDNIKADTGHEGASRREMGSYAETRLVTLSSSTGTNLFGASVSRPDGMCFNNTSGTIWIGTTTATATAVPHSNMRMGFPLLSSSTFRLDGSFTGTIAGTCDAGVLSCTLRCVDGLVR